MLNETIKKELLKKIEEIDIDVSQLDSYHWDNDTYGLEPALAYGSGQGVWDENEEWQEQLKTMVNWLEADGLNEYATLSDDEQEQDEKDRSLTNQAIAWVNTLIKE